MASLEIKIVQWLEGASDYDWWRVTASWYLATLAVTIALAPVSLLAFRHVRDYGASVARPVAGLLMIWPVWLIASIGTDAIPFNRRSLWVTVGIIGLVSWLIGWRKGLVNRVALRHLLIAEVGFLVAFAAFIYFHGYAPETALQEKPSDLMMLSSTMRAEQMPPDDAWLANHTINYYYIGYVIWAGFAGISGAIPVEAYNLGLASTFGMTVVAIIGLANNALGTRLGSTKTRIGGVLAAVFVVLLGNPWAARTILADPLHQWNAEDWPGPGSGFVSGVGWQATRIIFDDFIHNPITEMPIFSFILSDFHPHLIAYPYTVTALMCAWMLLMLRPESGGIAGRLPGALPRVGFAGGVIGALYGINSWDFPTYLAIGMLALLLGLRHRSWLQRLIAIAVLALSGIICWLPFHTHLVAPTLPADHTFAQAVKDVPVLGNALSSLMLFQHERTSFVEYLSMFGFMYVFAVALILAEGWHRRRVLANRLAAGTAVIVTGALIVGWVGYDAPLLVLVGIPLLAIAMLIVEDRRLSPANVALGLFGIAFVLTLGPEFFYVRDYFDARMNTVFKIYYQVWLHMGIATGMAISVLWSLLNRARLARMTLAGSVVVILLGGLTYPVVAGKQWLDWLSPEREWVGVDGLAYLDVETRPGSYEALNWLWHNAKPDDAMLSAGGCEWSWIDTRPSSVTGVPTILGWPVHEVQWHLNPEDDRDNVEERVDHINALFAELDSALLDKYGITLIYIGPAERRGGTREPSERCATGPFFNDGPLVVDPAKWTQVFASGEVLIFRRIGTRSIGSHAMDSVESPLQLVRGYPG